VEFIVYILVVWIVVGWIRQKLNLSVEDTFDCASVGCGLFLVVGMTATGIVMWDTPGLERGFTLYFFLWAALGVVLMVKGVRGR
jgi:hypothetical protein